MAGPSLQDLQPRLAAISQDHLLRFFPQLNAEEQSRLLAQIASLDLESLPALIKGYVLNKPHFSLPPGLEPAPYYPFDPRRAGQGTARSYDRAAMWNAGEALIRAGKVAAFVVAGGQGSRLGYEGPKGCYAAGGVTGKSLFQFFAENLLGAKDRYSVDVPWYIMTSPLNHEATTSFFESNKYFGLNRASVKFFPQGVLPSLDIHSGKVLMSSKSEIATNPDGHGGSLKALMVSGAIHEMKSRGVTHISYFQVDNPSVRVLDPVFLGLHASNKESSAEMSSKMVTKANAEEKVGVFCKARGKVEVIEYSDLPMDLQRERLADNSLRFLAGSIAIHAIGVDFVERVSTDPKFQLPYHRAEKKIPCIDPGTGNAITPTSNNGVKLERFVFDALAFAKDSIVYETDRVEEFAPIKNATGADSPQSSRDLQTLRAARWLERAGVAIPKNPDGSPDCVIELSPRTACFEEHVKHVKLPKAIDRGAKVSL